MSNEIFSKENIDEAQRLADALHKLCKEKRIPLVVAFQDEPVSDERLSTLCTGCGALDEVMGVVSSLLFAIFKQSEAGVHRGYVLEATTEIAKKMLSEVKGISDDEQL